MKRRRKKATPVMLLWSRAEQRRFIDAVESCVSAVRELGILVAELAGVAHDLSAARYKRSAAASKANATRAAARLAAAEKEGLNGDPFNAPEAFTDPDM